MPPDIPTTHVAANSSPLSNIKLDASSQAWCALKHARLAQKLPFTAEKNGILGSSSAGITALHTGPEGKAPLMGGCCQSHRQLSVKHLPHHKHTQRQWESL